VFAGYRLRYSDDSAAPLTTIVIHDQVPAYTQFGSALCLLLPAVGLTNCVISKPPANALSGATAWTMKDASTGLIGLQPSVSGSVIFFVQVRQ
jgi:hypothetical protein